jgi:O-acetylhomoserine/O-acetylserine sulfhydrylase-like pyridoxal-dependent enzyme
MKQATTHPLILVAATSVTIASVFAIAHFTGTLPGRSDAAMRDTRMKIETLAVHGGYSPDPTTKAVAVPIYQTTSYAFDSTQHGADLFDLKVPGNIYTRIMNPTQDVLEKRVAAMEGGIAALAHGLRHGGDHLCDLQTIAEAGDNIVTSSTLYGGTYNLFAHTLPQYGIDVRFADYRDPAAFEKLIDGKTKAVFCESVGNPLGNVTDFEKLAESPTSTACRSSSTTPCPRPTCAARSSTAPTSSSMR